MSVEKELAKCGVFKGHNGLRGLSEASEFWSEQPYGTRLYYGRGGLQYLHRSVLKTAVDALDLIEAKDAEIERLLELTANDAKEIGSYSHGTGLRGENRALQAENERLKDEKRRLRIICAGADAALCHDSIQRAKELLASALSPASTERKEPDSKAGCNHSRALDADGHPEFYQCRKCGEWLLNTKSTEQEPD